MKGVVLKKALNIFNLAFIMSVLKLFLYINRNVAYFRVLFKCSIVNPNKTSAFMPLNKYSHFNPPK